MKKLQLLLAIALIALTYGSASCSKEYQSGLDGEEKCDGIVGLSIAQATELANLFTPLLEHCGKPEAKTKVACPQKVLNFIDVYVEEGDTLMYAFNYADNGGYVVIGADNTVFPILSHASHGNLRFDDIKPNSGVNGFLEAYKENIKRGKKMADISSEFYDNWKDLGKKGYEYEIELCPMVNNIETRSRRTYSSGKATIYPHTGEELDYWCQEGGYNYYAENKACIGCPAIAIGMLLYDTSERVLGTSTRTYPNFLYYDAYNIKDSKEGTATAHKLRLIADAIPNYHWGATAGAGSGASPEDILIGLHNLGYTKATLNNYNFETLYNNLTFKGNGYAGQEQTFSRGVLLGALATYSNTGHIWFCDGYYEQGYTVKKKFLGITIKTWNEYDDRLYMNWGWGPNGGNGWYCATDDGYWSSLASDTGLTMHLKRLPQMYINLSHYEIPDVD